MTVALITDKFVFIHVPKTGGEFFRLVVKQLGIPHDETGNPKKERMGLRRHHGIERVPEKLRRDRLVFGFVRHPVTWLMSRWSWYMWRKGPAAAMRRFESGRRDACAMVRRNFAEYVDLVLGHCPDAPTKEMLGRLGDARVYKYEDLEESITRVLVELGYRVPKGFVASLPRRNVSRAKGAYTADQPARILEANADFCTRFGYE